MAIMNKLCIPARFYLAISVTVLIMMIVQNLLNKDNKKLCVGSYKCNIPNVALFLGMETIYIAFWTWILNSLCKSGLKSVSWFLVLLPILIFSVVVSLLIYNDIEKNKRNVM